MFSFYSGLPFCFIRYLITGMCCLLIPWWGNARRRGSPESSLPPASTTDIIEEHRICGDGSTAYYCDYGEETDHPSCIELHEFVDRQCSTQVWKMVKDRRTTAVSDHECSFRATSWAIYTKFRDDKGLIYCMSVLDTFCHI